MATKQLKISRAHAVIAIGNHPISDSALADPFSYLSQLNFHSSLPYMKVHQVINLGAISVPGAAPTYSFDEQKYTRVGTTTLASPAAGVNFSLAYLVVNGIVYPNGFTFNESSSGYGHLRVTYYSGTPGYPVYLRSTITNHTNTVNGIYINKLEIALIG